MSETFHLPQPVTLVPVGAGAFPDVDHQVSGTCVDLAPDGVTIELDQADVPEASFVLVHRDGAAPAAAAGLVACSHAPSAGGKVRLHAQVGGIGQELLRPRNLMPRMTRETLRLALGFPDEVLQAWQAVGVLQAVDLGPLRLCPYCSSLPDQLRVCRRCGSTRARRETTFRCVECAYLGDEREFESGDGLRCPSCGAADLDHGSGLRSMTGAFRCQGCGAGEADLGFDSSCSGCGARFTEEQAEVRQLHGYRARPLPLGPPAPE